MVLAECGYLKVISRYNIYDTKDFHYILHICLPLPDIRVKKTKSNSVK